MGIPGVGRRKGILYFHNINNIYHQSLLTDWLLYIYKIGLLESLHINDK